MTGDVAAACTCVLENDGRLEKWREVCHNYYFLHDPSAKALLDAYEQAKQQLQGTVDDNTQSMDAFIAIDIPRSLSPCAVSNVSIVHPSVEDIGLARCPLPNHDATFDANLLQLEKIKTRVRGEYHSHLANARYDAFHRHLDAVQSCHYHVDALDGLLHIRPVPPGGYLRRSDDLDVVRGKLLRFLGDWVPHIGTHPFLHGLRRLLESNMASATVVGWQVSDAVFVESGGTEFAQAAATVLVDTLQCGHTVLSKDDDVKAADRLWVLDPYVSNAHLRRIVWLFPAPTSLEGRATGVEVPTVFSRPNARGQHDEIPAWRKVCTVL
ncbi:hypothetical protein H310_09725 [Aphanomyces invadans]|uniref:Uncharacterized protein n=1 Tax=Aphanomyces invadans TaxID=157072 RepID=A0A024TUW9_9STRA|nr:hypothetical protein H310_09725 [Aphanomyces invadans]ETV97391.1 hypothetical protein H310_09725 [Aphanomyces invadans]|eukprot:XP_008874099.1 hypothetical protein H310_09725 [Aphanomyces invadans]